MKQAEAIDKTPRAIRTKAPATKQIAISSSVFFFLFLEVKISNAVLFCILAGFSKIMEAAGSYKYMPTTINTAL
jgi:hypothetical protein